ncbi:hypothetical protein J3E69DRAFT_356176 [Trichoderma sp. SZMC 28015]
MSNKVLIRATPRRYAAVRVCRNWPHRSMECGGRSPVMPRARLLRMPCEDHAKCQLKCSDPLTCHISVCVFDLCCLILMQLNLYLPLDAEQGPQSLRSTSSAWFDLAIPVLIPTAAPSKSCWLG